MPSKFAHATRSAELALAVLLSAVVAQINGAVHAIIC